MFHLTVHTFFAAAHNLINYQGDCENLHGHNWKVEVTVGAQELDKAGLGIDFKILKSTLRTLLETLDHKHLNQVPPFDVISPSSENIARFLFDRLSDQLNNANIAVEKVNVWESDYACASYTRD
ncbi:MAG: 6-carboxytetrahydropterin synthase QueD [Desulfuromonadales bacterium GWD2_61_12]|nr:MAG: 6-carboxytetrahydropterin synthase QueD [Desulfuromonadales bacterium GWC2_61_20]OGR34756.1 MAG: 6-carboxytetrahydropterin synthase QueD [Desulfuromonadales bacterium GWD2_61_12]HAD04863.1 6-carboxytetrahydropterin synthase QueD [Desulfuromonas sp.]HBT83621.1 6-carboxytetrahydropterin synthase QueD [Desulfuromonas sp.]